MAAVEPGGNGDAEVRLRFGGPEVAVLRSVVDQLDGLLGEISPSPERRRRPGAEPSAPLDALAEMLHLPGPVESPTDPALRRLFPDAYQGDPSAAAEFRRYTQETLCAGKRADLGVVRRTLDEIEATGEAPVGGEQLDAWLRTLTDARLVLGVRLGIEREDDVERLEEELAERPTISPRAAAFGLFNWLGLLLEELVEAASGQSSG